MACSHHANIDQLGRMALEASNDGFFCWDIQTDKTFFSHRYLTMLGYKSDELPPSSDTWRMLIHHDDSEQMSEIVKEYFEGKRDSHIIEYRMRMKNGSWCWILSRGKIVDWDDSGSPTTIFGTHVDITNRKEVEKSLHTAQKRLRSLIEHTSDGVFCYEYSPPIPINLPCDQQVERFYDGVLVDCNLVCARSYGATQVEEVLGKTLTDLFGTRPGSLDRLFKSLIDGGYQVIDGEGIEELSDGSKRYFLNNGVGVIEDGLLIRIWGTFRDITTRKLAEQELQKAQKLESLGVLAGGIAHDFNNLLIGIFGKIELARNNMDKNGKAFKCLSEVMPAYTRAKELTHQLLTFSKGSQLSKKAVSLDRLIRESVKLSLSGSNVQLETVFSDDMCHIDADEGQICQVLNNIFINARQAMAGGGKIRIETRNISLEESKSIMLPQDSYIKIAITDEGQGIPAEFLPRVFDPFFTTKKEGSGLGLAMVYSIISKHKGHIKIDSEIGRGTTVTIFLPKATVTDMSIDTSSQQQINGTGRILIMDDEDFVLDVASEMLETLGYVVETAQSGEDALKIYTDNLKQDSPFDAVILDLTVRGGMGGKDLVTKLLDIDPHTKAIASTGYTDSNVLTNPQEFGFVAILSKPYQLEQLGATLSSTLKKDRVCI